MELQEALDFLGRVKQGAAEEFGHGREDYRDALKRGYAESGRETDGSKLNQTLGSNRTMTMLAEMTGQADPVQVEARKRMGLGMSDDKAKRIGQVLGSLGGDLVQDRGRSLWWLLNAPQAVGNVVQEMALHKHAPGLYQADPARDELGNPLTMKNKSAAQRMGYMNSKGETTKGVTISKGGNLRTRRYAPGMTEALMIPAGFAINSSIGLMNPFGGQEGYKAVLESDEDPSKTSNVLGEVAAKYVLGRTGNLLPWDEFKKVRPDVSKGEYMKYKAFKFDNSGDANIFDDGEVVLPTGVLKYTNEGIHGPEVQFLGRSLPLATGILPTVAAIAGTAYGARIGDQMKNQQGKQMHRGVRGGLIGGGVSLAASTILGNVIEGERRRRNAEENNQYN